MDDEPAPGPVEGPAADPIPSAPAAALPSISMDEDDFDAPAPKAPAPERPAPSAALPSVSLDDDEPGLSVSLPPPTPRAPLPPRDEPQRVLEEPEVESRYGEPSTPPSPYTSEDGEITVAVEPPSPQQAKARAQDPAVLAAREREFRKRLWSRWLLHGVSGIVLCFVVKSAFNAILGGMAAAMHPMQLILNAVPSLLLGFPLGFCVSRFNAGVAKGAFIGLAFGVLFGCWSLMVALLGGDPLGYVHLAGALGVGGITGALMGVHVDMDH